MTVDVAAHALDMDMADRMRKCLRVADVPIQTLADELGVSRNTISTWINGRIVPPLPMQKLWALRFAEYGVTIGWLQTGQAPRSGGPDGYVAGAGFEPATSGLRVVPVAA